MDHVLWSQDQDPAPHWDQTSLNLSPVVVRILVELAGVTFSWHMLTLLQQIIQVENLSNSEQELHDSCDDYVLILIWRREQDHLQTMKQLGNLENNFLKVCCEIFSQYLLWNIFSMFVMKYFFKCLLRNIFSTCWGERLESWFSALLMKRIWRLSARWGCWWSKYCFAASIMQVIWEEMFSLDPDSATSFTDSSEQLWDIILWARILFLFLSFWLQQGESGALIDTFFFLSPAPEWCCLKMDLVE